VRVGAARLAWSSDGTRIAFEKGDSPKPGPSYQAPTYQGLWVIDGDGSGAREVFANADPQGYQSYLAGWTPDGKSLLYWEGRYGSGSIMADGLPLMQIPLAGGRPTQVSGTKMLVHPELLDWSRDGRLAMVDGGYRNSWERKQIAVAAPGRFSVLSDKGRSDLFPAWSPDGRLVAFSSGPAAPGIPGGDDAKKAMAERHIWLMQPDGSGKLQITKDAAYCDERPLWSRDSSHILFGRLADERLRLWLMRSDGSEQRPVVDELGSPPKPGQPIWFGYYGYINWPDLYDWWQEKPSMQVPSPQQGEPARLGQDAWAQVRIALPDSVPVYRPDSLMSPSGLAVLEEVENDVRQGPRYTVVYQGEDELVAFILGMGKGALGNSPPPDSTEPITVHGVRGELATTGIASPGSRKSQIVSWQENGRHYEIKVLSNRITKDELKQMAERLVALD
jgi:dipeptidyl aminopeptidase/acylaminoacyl peptidase